MFTRLGAAFIAAASILSAATIPVDAANPPRVQGQSCSKLKAAIGKSNVWSTSFVGQRKGPFDRIESYQAAPCFRSQADCKAWLYWAQSDWDYYQYSTRAAKAFAGRRAPGKPQEKGAANAHRAFVVTSPGNRER